jgi:DNA-binding CsgD family transcriptional regulator
VTLEAQVKALQVQLLSAEMGGSPWLPAFLDELRELLGARNAIAYRPTPNEKTWDLEFAVWTGKDSERPKNKLLRYVQSCASDAPRFAAYNPFAVQPQQRNVALSTADLFAVERSAPLRHAHLHSALGTDGNDQVRLLVCEGPRLLAWVGAIREEPFQRREIDALQTLADPLRRRLVAERQVPVAELRAACLDALLDALDYPAMVFDEHGAVELSNEPGLKWLDMAHRANAIEPLRAALISGGRHPDFSLIRLESRGCPGYVLALSTAGSAIGWGVARATKAWKLNSRQSSVVEQVASGKTNKEIAKALGCAEVTIEKYLTQIFRASGASSRVEIAAMVRGPWPPASSR